MTQWTPQETETMWSLISKGHTSPSVAKLMTEQFKRPFSKNAILGKMHRNQGGIIEYLFKFTDTHKTGRDADRVREVIKMRKFQRNVR